MVFGPTSTLPVVKAAEGEMEKDRQREGACRDVLIAVDVMKRTAMRI
jgi:hypothetical protein